MEIEFNSVVLSSEYNEEDEVMSFVEDGMKYSCDGIRLLKVIDNCSDKIVVRKDVLVICNEAFSKCMASEVVLPDSLILIGDRAFEASTLETVTIPTTVLEIGALAFSGCHKLKRVFFKNMKLLKIGKNAFECCCNLEPNCKTEIEEQFGSRVFNEENSQSSSSSSSEDYQDSYGSGTDSSDYVFGQLKDNEPWWYVP